MEETLDGECRLPDARPSYRAAFPVPVQASGFLGRQPLEPLTWDESRGDALALKRFFVVNR